jgi:hypothetical protein
VGAGPKTRAKAVSRYTDGHTRVGGVSSAPRLRGPIAGVSGILEAVIGRRSAPTRWSMITAIGVERSRLPDSQSVRGTRSANA